MKKKHTTSEAGPALGRDGFLVSMVRAEDGVMVVQIDTPSAHDVNGNGTPRCRVWINEALIHDENGECLIHECPTEENDACDE